MVIGYLDQDSTKKTKNKLWVENLNEKHTEFYFNVWCRNLKKSFRKVSPIESQFSQDFLHLHFCLKPWLLRDYRCQNVSQVKPEYMNFD